MVLSIHVGAIRTDRSIDVVVNDFKIRSMSLCVKDFKIENPDQSLQNTRLICLWNCVDQESIFTKEILNNFLPCFMYWFYTGGVSVCPTFFYLWHVQQATTRVICWQHKVSRKKRSGSNWGDVNINRDTSHTIACVKRGKFDRIFLKEVCEMYDFAAPGTGPRH